jgi:hypothetical protein
MLDYPRELEVQIIIHLLTAIKAHDQIKDREVYQLIAHGQGITINLARNPEADIPPQRPLEKYGMYLMVLKIFQLKNR